MDSVAVMEVPIDGGRPAPPSSSWLAQARSTKPVKEVSAAVGSGSVYVTKAVPVEAGAGNKAVAEAAEGEKRTKTMRVKQGYIDSLLEKYPFKPYPWEQLEKTEPDPEIREMLRAAIAPAAAIMKATRDKDEAIVRQYLALGYAEEEVEVSDDDEA